VTKAESRLSLLDWRGGLGLPGNSTGDIDRTDPAQAKIEAESIKGICEKYQANSDPDFRTRAIVIKEQRAELVKHHLWVLWTDYFKPPHFEKYPNLHQLFNEATKLAGASGAKGSADPAVADQLLGKIDEISKIFWETKQA
jgi:nickel superoxide dismutase